MKTDYIRYGVTAWLGSLATGALIVAYPSITLATLLLAPLGVGLACAFVAENRP